MAERPPRNPAQAAARAALLAPLVAFGISVATFVMLNQRPTDYQPEYWERMTVTLAGAFCEIALCVVGIVAAIVALVRMRKHGREGVLAQACIGLTLNILILGLLAAGFVGGMMASAHLRQALDAQQAADARLDTHLKEITDLAQQNANGAQVTTQAAEVMDKLVNDVQAAAQAERGKDRAALEFLGE